MSNPGKRLYYLDAVRVLACVMVVFAHAPGPFKGAVESEIFQNIINFMTAPCIGLFFMVSGALVLPVKCTTIGFLKHRLTKIVWPTLSWTVFYMIANYYLYGGCDELISCILSIPFSPQGSGVLWFMYTLVGLYLVAPIISPWLVSVSKRTIELYLILWAISICFPLLESYVIVRTDTTGPLYYLSGYIGYFILGYYMNRWPSSIKWRYLVPMIAISLIVPIYCKLTGIHVDFFRVFWYLSIFIAIMCAGWFKAFESLLNRPALNDKRYSILTNISSLSFGIYLSHIIILRSLMWNWKILDSIHNFVIHTFAVAVFTFVAALVISYLLSLLPFGIYIVGVRNKINCHRKSK